MKKASEYKTHAQECRQLAATMGGEQRQLLLEMAATWDQLAEDRERLVLVATRSFSDDGRPQEAGPEDRQRRNQD